MSNIFRTRYRIVTDRWNGYEAQFRYWWMPIYVQCFFSNTKRTIEESLGVIERHKRPIVVVIE